jgi:hypothetical protein
VPVHALQTVGARILDRQRVVQVDQQPTWLPCTLQPLQSGLHQERTQRLADVLCRPGRNAEGVGHIRGVHTIHELALDLGYGLGRIGHQQAVDHVDHVTTLWHAEREPKSIDERA